MKVGVLGYYLGENILNSDQFLYNLQKPATLCPPVKIFFFLTGEWLTERKCRCLSLVSKKIVYELASSTLPQRLYIF